jgi:hypothetical protein
MEEPEGDLGKDDWEKVERVGYDWQEEGKEADVKGWTDSKTSNVSRIKTLPR